MTSVVKASNGRKTKGVPMPVEQDGLRAAKETREQRVRRIYAAQGGALIGWLLDEARRRGHELNEMARELGVTYGYISQLRSGLRCTAHISQEMANACSRYLGVPPVVVKVVCGRILMSDFVSPAMTEEQVYDRAIRRMQDDPEVRQAIPVDFGSLPIEARKALAMLYAESTCGDLFGHRELPEMLQYLQRATVNHEAAEFERVTGHGDTAVREECLIG